MKWSKKKRDFDNSEGEYSKRKEYEMDAED